MHAHQRCASQNGGSEESALLLSLYLVSSRKTQISKAKGMAYWDGPHPQLYVHAMHLAAFYFSYMYVNLFRYVLHWTFFFLLYRFGFFTLIIPHHLHWFRNDPFTQITKTKSYLVILLYRKSITVEVKPNISKYCIIFGKIFMDQEMISMFVRIFSKSWHHKIFMILLILPNIVAF